MELKDMDTPMLRDLYRAIRKNCVELCGGSTASFDAKIRQAVAPMATAREIVSVALTFEEQCIADYQIRASECEW